MTSHEKDHRQDTKGPREGPFWEVMLGSALGRLRTAASDAQPGQSRADQGK